MFPTVSITLQLLRRFLFAARPVPIFESPANSYDRPDVRRRSTSLLLKPITRRKVLSSVSTLLIRRWFLFVYYSSYLAHPRPLCDTLSTHTEKRLANLQSTNYNPLATGSSSVSRQVVAPISSNQSKYGGDNKLWLILSRGTNLHK